MDQPAQLLEALMGVEAAFQINEAEKLKKLEEEAKREADRAKIRRRGRRVRR